MAGIERRWIGTVRTTRHDGRGWWVLRTRAGTLPPKLREVAVEHDGRLLVPITPAAGEVLREQRSARLDVAAERCLSIVELGDVPPPARLVLVRGLHGIVLKLEVVWDPDAGAAFEGLPGAEGNE